MTDSKPPSDSGERQDEKWYDRTRYRVLLFVRADLLVMCATYGWSYDDTKTRPWRPTTETQTA
jgi:hypothetical protein